MHKGYRDYFSLLFSSVMVIVGCWALWQSAPITQHRMPSSQSTDHCMTTGNCPFLNIGHRGAPFDAPENTIESFEKALQLGANALELDLIVTKDLEVVVFHDHNPDNIISIGRQSGFEGLPYIPYLPDLGSPYRRNADELTYQEFVHHYGLARSHGAVADIFVNGERVDVKLPTLDEFFAWSSRQEQLKFVVLDIKIPGDKPELMNAIIGKLDHWSPQLSYSMIFSSPDKSLFYKSRAAPIRHTWERLWQSAIDFEESGALAEVKKNNIPSLMIGKTMLRSWDGFWQELNQLLGWREMQSLHAPYPIIAWTIDQQERLYQLVGTSVDGIITNRPRDLARIKSRHFDDHHLLAHHIVRCHQENQGHRRWAFCADGGDIRPLWPMGEREFKDWAKTRHNKNLEIKSLLGIGLGNAKRVSFDGAIDESGNSWMWYMPERRGSVVIKRAQEEFNRPMRPIVLDFVQRACNDGFLNYDCEYRMFVSYLNPDNGHWVELINNGVPFDSSFYYLTHIPDNARMLRVQIYETDDGQLQRYSYSLDYLPLQNEYSKATAARDKTFKGQITLYDYPRNHNLPPDEAGKDSQRFSVRYQQQDCYDGVANSDCEYRMTVSYSYNGAQFLALDHVPFNFESSGEFHHQVPKGVQKLKVILQETDDGSPANAQAMVDIDIDFVGGERHVIQSIDRRTFKGVLTINKFFDHRE